MAGMQKEWLLRSVLPSMEILEYKPFREHQKSGLYWAFVILIACSASPNYLRIQSACNLSSQMYFSYCCFSPSSTRQIYANFSYFLLEVHLQVGFCQPIMIYFGSFEWMVPIREAFPPSIAIWPHAAMSSLHVQRSSPEGNVITVFFTAIRTSQDFCLSSRFLLLHHPFCHQADIPIDNVISSREPTRIETTDNADY